jgi:hypothetical protein
VVAVGFKVVEPLADEDRKLPGVIATLVAPVVAKASVMLDPNGTLVGLAVNELMLGSGTVTVILAVAVTEPLASVALSV